MSGDYEREVTFEIIEHIGVLATSSTGWRKELNFVSWNGAPGKYDIRDWDPSHERMSRGITLKENEMRLLLEVMKRRRVAARQGGSSFEARNLRPAKDEPVLSHDEPVISQAEEISSDGFISVSEEEMPLFEESGGHGAEVEAEAPF